MIIVPHDVAFIYNIWNDFKSINQIKSSLEFYAATDWITFHVIHTHFLHWLQFSESDVSDHFTCTHDPMNSRLRDATLHIRQVLDVTVGKHWNGHIISDSLDVIPVCQARITSLLLPISAMNCQQLNIDMPVDSGLCIFQRLHFAMLWTCCILILLQ